LKKYKGDKKMDDLIKVLEKTKDIIIYDKKDKKKYRIALMNNDKNEIIELSEPFTDNGSILQILINVYNFYKKNNGN